MEKKSDSLLIIFYRNPQLGKVKTRLAATMGNEAALEIYLKLAKHTRSVTENISIDKVIYYSDFIDKNDFWNNHQYRKALQSGNDLGEKMKHAFSIGFHNGYHSICIIGTDCLELTEDFILNAFENLQSHDAVIGPAKDGGYYLLGTKKLYPEIFNNKNWSTDTVFTETIHNFNSGGLSYYELPELRDIDKEEDLLL